MSYIPERGDIIQINFDPSVGKEITKYRPALVLSFKVFNDNTCMVVACPITNTKRGFDMEIPLPSHLITTGTVQTWQLRAMDWIERNAKFVEKVPGSLMQRVDIKTKLCIGCV